MTFLSANYDLSVTEFTEDEDLSANNPCLFFYSLFIKILQNFSIEGAVPHINTKCL